MRASAMFLLLLLPSFLLTGYCAPADRCLMLDSCYFKTDAKSCSCRPDCRLYGTCCLGVAEGAGAAPPSFQCYGRRTRTPLFVARSCKPGYRGHPHDGATCMDDDEDAADVVGNLLVTNRETKVTYWNRQCARCNDEDVSKLDVWDVVVQCEAREGVDRSFIRRHLSFDRGALRWGVKAAGEFLPCTVHYSPPDSLHEVKHCTPNVIQTCPPDYPDRERARKCSQSYAERKLKDAADVHFRNVHCAICNGVDESEVECTGMSSGPQEDSADEGDFREVTEVVFSGGEWLHREPGRRFECSPGYVYDPFRGRCRTSGTKGGGDVPLSSAPVCSGTTYLLLLATLSAAFLL